MPSLNPRLFEWARNTAGLSIEDAASALGLSSADRLSDIERGGTEPSHSLLLKMSKHYRRPLVAFYLAEPPRKADRGEDFRSMSGDRSSVVDPLLDVLIRDLRARQSIVRASLEDEEQERLPFVGSARIGDGRASVLHSIQKTLRVDLRTYRSYRTTKDAFGYLRERVESVGIFALLVGDLGSYHTAIPVEAFRGFAIADPIAPFVVINDQDSHTAWSFTLIHEVAHLWLGTTGVSAGQGDLAIEQFCNDVAAEFLLPIEDLHEVQVAAASNGEEAIARISAFAEERHLSRLMVTYRLFRSGAISRDVWAELDHRLREIWHEEKRFRKERNRRHESGPSYYVVRRHRLGRALLEFARRNVAAGTLSPAKASLVLGVKPRSVYPLLMNVDHQGPRASAAEP